MNPDDAAAAMTNPDGTVDMDTPELPAPETPGGLGDDLGDGLDGSGLDDAPGGRSLVDRLLSTEPDTPLNQVENPWDPDAGGPTRIYRGVQKLGDIEGMPAIVDIAIGVVETIHGMDTGDGDDSASDSGGSDGEDSGSAAIDNPVGSPL